MEASRRERSNRTEKVRKLSSTNLTKEPKNPTTGSPVATSLGEFGGSKGGGG